MSRLHPASKSAIVPEGVNFAFYRTSVIAKLHQRLAKTDEATDDITVHTITCLILADVSFPMHFGCGTGDLTVNKFFAGHDEHAATQLKGLQATVSSRGGLDGGGFDRFAIYNLTGKHPNLRRHWTIHSFPTRTACMPCANLLPNAFNKHLHLRSDPRANEHAQSTLTRLASVPLLPRFHWASATLRLLAASRFRSPSCSPVFPAPLKTRP